MTVSCTTRTNRQIGLLPSEQLMAAAADADAAARVESPFLGQRTTDGPLREAGGAFDS